MNKSESIKEIAAALSKAQGELKNAKRDKINPFFKSKYADLPALWNASRSVLAKYGLSIVQGAPADEKSIIIETLLMHESGEWIESQLTLHAEKPTPQSMGSAITYGRRYSLAAMLGLVADEDDDGNIASKETKKKQPIHDPSRQQIVDKIVNILTDKVFDDKDRKEAKEQIHKTKTNIALEALCATYENEKNERIKEVANNESKKELDIF